MEISSPRPTCLGHRYSEHKLARSHCLCLPSHGSPSQGDPKNRQCIWLIIITALGWPGIPRFWDLVQLSTEIPLMLPVSTKLPKQSHNQVLHSNPQHLNHHAWCLGVDSSQEQDTLGAAGLHISQSSDLNRLLSSLHRDCCKSPRNLPNWNLSVVLNELTKAPFEPMKDTDLKHLTLITAFLLAMSSSKHCSEIHAWVAKYLV